MDRLPGRITILSILGSLGAVAAVVSIVFIGNTFGYPGTADYRIYENFNRAMALFLALQTAAIVGFGLQYRGTLGRIGQVAVVLAVVTWIGMALGTAAEFWLYSDLPYGQGNERDTAFVVFSISSLLGDLALLALGFELLFSRTLPRIFAVLMILYLPLDIILWFSGQSVFLASALVALAIAVMVLRGNKEQGAGNKQEARN